MTTGERTPVRRLQTTTVRRLSSVVLILLIAFAFRTWALLDVPPGLTHDEANHGREAIEVLSGVYRYFFPLNYGSEPLYSYTVALVMALAGRGVLALRLVNVYFGLLAVAATYGWAAPRLGRPAALLGAALMAVSFWPVAASREALRAGMLPFFMTLAVWCFWRVLERAGGRQRRAAVLFGVCLGLTLHIYLAARVSWLLFPLFLGYLALVHRDRFRRAWRQALLGLLLGGLLAAPLFLYLQAHPEMQTRLDMLDGPLQAITAGQWRLVLANAANALLAFVWPGRGDGFLAYNIPGRPVFDTMSAVFFVVGLVVCLWRWRQPVYAFLLLWFLVGILPSLITGPTANTTRNLAALPAACLLPAVGFLAAAERVGRAVGRRGGARSRVVPWAAAAAVGWLAFAAFVAGRDYFVRWANLPDVRGAYQATTVAAVRHVLDHYPDADLVFFSSVYPGAAHDPSIALVLAADQPAISETARWADARWALVLPPGETLAVIPASTPPHLALAPWLEPLETVAMRPDDLDPSFTVYRLDGARAAAELAKALPAAGGDFDGAAELRAAGWLASPVAPGGTGELLTLWRVLDPARDGPARPPTFASDAVLFTHILDDAGSTVAQRDSLDAPSWAWRAGDWLAQVHPLGPAPAEPGAYPALVGFYDRATGARLPVLGGGDTAALPPLRVEP